MIVCIPSSNPDAPGIGGCAWGHQPVYVGTDTAGFQPLTLLECTGFLCDMAVQDVAFAALVVVAFSIGFAAGFMLR